MIKVIGYCLKGAKEYIAFADQGCGESCIKITDGFHDKLVRKNSRGMAEIQWVSKSAIDTGKIVKRLRGARPWHPILGILRKELDR